eukprot:gb/GECG01010649.1/.p1 GENE.gb/GECG01010649.1/~~gb/GECG01010649.1/.p1  ORF type:complete len:221 (+),score=24.46 gb/GECG01010649.1/:1-663(+)
MLRRSLYQCTKKPRTRGVVRSSIYRSVPFRGVCGGIYNLISVVSLSYTSTMSSASSSFCTSAGDCSTNLPDLVQRADGQPWFPVLSFWFPEADDKGTSQFQPWWFQSSKELDRQLREQFEPLLLRFEEDASSLDEWNKTTMGGLAKTILLDQFPRNIYRGTEKAFAYDKYAQEVCLKGLSDRRWDALPETMRLFALTPLMHAEDMDLQEKSVEEFTKVTI